jgi:hypothetical protein
MQWEPIAIPLASGVDLTSRVRLVDPANLAKAENVYYPQTGGPEKRRGHKAHRLFDAFAGYEGPAPSDNLFGYGLIDAGNPPSGSSVYPQAGTIRDILVYDDREIAWDGWRFFEPTEAGVSGKCKVVKAYLPVYKSEAIARTQNTQLYSCSAETALTRIVGYVETVAGGAKNAYAKVYDVATNSLKFTVHLNTGSNDPVYIRTVSCGEFVHALVSDATDEVVYCYSFHNNATDLTRVTPVITIDGVVGTSFDVWKFNESRFLVAGIDTTIKLSWVNANGTVNETMFSQNTTFAVTGTPLNVAVCVHPVTRNIGVFYDIGVTQFFRLYDDNGTALAAATSISSWANDVIHLAVAPSYVDDKYYLYCDRYGGGTMEVVKSNFTGPSTLGTVTRRKSCRLASRACRVGNVGFVWVTNVTDNHVLDALQSTYFLLDEDLKPVARAEYTTAVINGYNKWLPGINYVESADGSWNTTKFHGSLMVTTRIIHDDDGTGTTAVFSDYGIKTYTLNFTPDKLSYAQAGKALYIAGGQLWSYDGEVLREANIPLGVDDVTIVSSNGAGALENSGVYSWRIDYCYKNAQNEECRAISFLTNDVTFGGVDDTATLTIYQPLTGITDGYYLIFRKMNNGSNWYLVNNRISSPLKYDPTAVTVTFTDLLSDADILDNEPHPANAAGFIQPIAAPACEYVAFGQNRLWVAGGEITPGEIWPSRLFGPGQTPAFNWVLAFQVDRTTEPVTGFAFQTTYGVVFKRDSIYIVTGNISSNILEAVQPDVQQALADRGCINHKSIGRLFNSVTFQSSSGYQSINAAGQMDNIGSPVLTAAGTCVGTLLVKHDEHIRFYQSDNATLVLDYGDKLWTTFNFNTKPNAAVLSNRTGMAVLARRNELLYESDDEYRDGDYAFYYLIRTAPLAKQIGGLQRVRRVYCIGEKEGVPPPVTIRIYQDTHDWWTAQVNWDYSDDLNTSTIGTGTIGTGFIGDPVVSTPPAFRDDIWRWRYRLPSRHQKCEDVAIELTDKGRMNQNRWIPVAFALEIGTKGGLDRLSHRTINEE